MREILKLTDTISKGLYDLPYYELKLWQQIVAIEVISDLFRRKLLNLNHAIKLLVS